MPRLLTPDEAYRRAWEAGATSALEGGRDVWSDEDRSACIAEYERLLSIVEWPYGTFRAGARIDRQEKRS